MPASLGPPRLELMSAPHRRALRYGGPRRVRVRPRTVERNRDPGLNDHVDRPAGHDQVLDIVAANENETAPCIEIGLLHHINAPFRPLPEKSADGPHRSAAEIISQGESASDG